MISLNDAQSKIVMTAAGGVTRRHLDESQREITASSDAIKTASRSMLDVGKRSRRWQPKPPPAR
jgi:hypothetical protein